MMAIEKNAKFSDRYNIWMCHTNETTETLGILICGAIEVVGKPLIVYNDTFTSLSLNAQDYMIHRTIFFSSFPIDDPEDLPDALSLHIMGDLYAASKIGKQNTLDAFHESLKLLGVEEMTDDLKQREAVINLL